MLYFRMVRNYKRTTNRGTWSNDLMEKAVAAVIEGKMGYFLAAKTFCVPQTTLERKVKIVRESSKEKMPLKIRLGPKSPVFSDEEENELCDYLLDMETRLYGLTTKDLKAIAYQLAMNNNKSNPFNTKKEEAGKDWVYGFLKRHPQLSIRKPENTSAARAAGFNKVSVEKFFNFLGKVYDDYHLSPDRVYNCDETGFSVVPKTKSKIVATKGRKQVGTIVSAERGQTVTAEICFNAAGNYMPPMLIFPRKRMKPELMVNAQAGAWGTCSESGWMTSELFMEWFKKFLIFSGASKERPVLLLLDGHSTHTKNLDLINEARANGVIILCFPPHTTHRLQVVDVAFMRPLSIYYDQAITSWLRSNPGMVVTIRQVAEVFGKAFVQAATITTAINGFRKCGIWPFDPNVFSDSDFAASLTTDIQLPENQLETSIESSLKRNSTITTVNDDPREGCSSWSDPEEHSELLHTPQSSQIKPLIDKTNFVVISPKQLMPYPAIKKDYRPIRKRGKSAILTSSPYKQELEEVVQNKKDMEKKKQSKRQLELKEKSSATKKSRNRKEKKKATKYVIESSSDTSNDENNNPPCLYCKGLYLESNEGWICCISCGKWAHYGCAGVDDDDDLEVVHICEFCQQA